MLEVADYLIAQCRAGRSGRKLSLVGAFAAYESDLVAQRDALAAIDAQKAAAKSKEAAK